ncbi:MAG: hypothetical protein EBU90_12570 [Proteobacteria bacterium]|nr:hypothetical protein [Pseudomonadota bacterium]NBP15155.1 hypothetical protein [bacterium]
MNTLILAFYLLIGKVEQTDDGLYIIPNVTDAPACKGEIFQWIESGVFYYDDFLCEDGELE